MMATHIERMLGEFGCARHLVLLISLLLLFLMTPFVASFLYGAVIEERRWGIAFSRNGLLVKIWLLFSEAFALI